MGSTNGPAAVKRWLREPLLHFLLLGLGIFVAFAAFGPDEPPPSTIVVTQGIIDAQVEGFSRTWLRQPTPQEIDDLVREYVREEVYYREGMALGLDRDDTVIRRRLRQKLEFVTESEAESLEPTDEQLRAYLGAHRDQYRTDARLSFLQVYLNPEHRGAELAGDMERLLAQLRAGGPDLDPAEFGDATMLERVFNEAAARDVAAQFGAGFAEQVATLPVGQWQGPVESAYGMHAVLLRERTEGRAPPLDEVRDTVRRDWLNEQRTQADEKFYQSLLQRYTVTIEGR